MDDETVHTHYDNLKVTRNAPVEVIKAAYRAMAQKYHPDVNKSPGAERVMKIVNEAWEVLSDPVERQKHDQWIAAEEQRIATARTQQGMKDRPVGQERAGTGPSAAAPAESNAGNMGATSARPRKDNGARNIIVGGLAILLLVVVFSDDSIEGRPATNTAPPNGPVPISNSVSDSVREAGIERSGAPPDAASAPKAVTERFEPPSTDILVPDFDRRLSLARLGPDQVLPESTGYILGSPRLARSGHSKLTIDNTSNSSDVVIKVCRAHSQPCDQVRHAFVRMGDSFTFEHLTPGSYDIRYASLDSGGLNKSEPFDLEQLEEEGGTRYSVLSLTLYTVAGGNTRMERIDSSQF